MARERLTDSFRLGLMDGRLIESIEQHENLRAICYEFVAKEIEVFPSCGLRDALRKARKLDNCPIKKIIVENEVLKKELEATPFDGLLQRALRAGVFDEIGWAILDEEIEKD